MYRFEQFLKACACLLVGSLFLLVLVGIPAGLYQSSVSQQKIINERCGYDYTVRDYFLNGDSIAAMCGIEQQQIHLRQDQ